jgi:transposase
MAMTIVETGAVTGGVDTHRDVHAAAVVDHLGGVLGVELFDTTERGYAQLWCWMRGFGDVARVGVEGTGSYGAGIARFLHGEAVSVIEVARPNRQARRQHGKSDPLDALSAARAALSQSATAMAKVRDGRVEAMRALLVVKRSARQQRTAAINQLRAVIVTAPDAVRDRFRGLSTVCVLNAAVASRARSHDPATHAAMVAVGMLGRRARDLEAEMVRADELIKPLIAAHAPDLLALYGVGPDTAATLIVTAGENPERIRNEAAFAQLCGVAPLQASSGQTIRHRLNRGGDRYANQALWRIVMTRLSGEPRTRAYCERRLSEGLSKLEIIRCLKRYVAREVFAYLRPTPALSRD